MNRALSQSDLGHHAASAQLLRDMLPTVRRVLGPDHTETAYAERMLTEIEARMHAQEQERLVSGDGADGEATEPPGKNN
jgi:hypothetical protein